MVVLTKTNGESSSRVTIVVPTRNSARTIDACLRSLRTQTVPCTVVVVDNHSTDETVNLAKPLADIVISAGSERSSQRNYGARTAPAPLVGFIDSDMVVNNRVVEEAAVAIESGAGAVIVPERSFGIGYWAQVRAYERSLYNESDAVEAARFFSYEVFDGVGGFDETLTGPEDWDLTIRARTVARVARISAGIDHDEGALKYTDACRRKAYYAMGLRRYVQKHGFAVLRTMGSRPWLAHPTKTMCRHGVGLLALKLGETVAVSFVLARDRLINRDSA